MAEAPSSEKIISLAPCEETETCFYAATHHAVFRYNNRWELVFSLSRPGEKVIRIEKPNSTNSPWIQTNQGVYLWDVRQRNFLRAYLSRDEEKKPLCFFEGDKKLWLGTSSGIWSSPKANRLWQKISSLADSLPVWMIRETSIGLFFGAGEKLYLAENDSVQPVLVFFDASSESEEEEVEAQIFQQSFFDLIETHDSFYAATSKGVFQSANGQDWTRLPLTGLQTISFRQIFWNASLKQLGGLTNKGVFYFESSSKQWRSLHQGLAKIDSSALLAFKTSWLTATSEGLWQWFSESPPASVSREKAVLFNRMIRLEPSIQEIHQRVIKFSGTSNSKIIRWHMESRLAALAPNISLGKDWGRSNNIDLDRGGTNDPDRFIDGPWDQDRGTDLDFSWDLGDFIFSSSQTSIDSRAKLMVDQRNDLLSEATRLYYERRRLQAEMIYAPAPDEKAHFDRLLRVEEVAALLDALTDGYFLKKLKDIYRAAPELNALWQFTSEPVRDPA